MAQTDPINVKLSEWVELSHAFQLSASLYYHSGPLSNFNVNHFSSTWNFKYDYNHQKQINLQATNIIDHHNSVSCVVKTGQYIYNIFF